VENLVLREYRSKEDMAGTYDLAEVAYVEDYARIGRDVKAGLRREQRVAAVLSGLSRIFRALRDLSTGYVWARDGRIVSCIHYARCGLDGDRWSIETLMTHPDEQRKGLARTLVQKSLEAIRARGGRTCELKVRADNESAYALYRSFGFTPVDSTVHLKNETPPDGETIGDSAPYVLQPATAAEWAAGWNERYELARRERGSDLELLFPLSPNAFRKPPYARWLAPILMRMSGIRGERWIVKQEKAGRWVGTLSAICDRTGGREHELTMSIDPEAEADVAQPLLATGLEWLDGSGDQPVLLELSAARQHALREARALGFHEIMTWHRLVLRLDSAPDVG